MFDIFLAFPDGLGCRGWADTDDGLSRAPFIIRCGVCRVWFLALVDGPFFSRFRGFWGACFGLIIRVSVWWRPGIGAGVSGFGLSHW